MASDNHAHFTRIGFTVIVGAVAIAATLVYLGGFHDGRSEVYMETFSDHPVSGLTVGSPVNLLGVKVGEVREITFASSRYYGLGTDTNDFGRVCIVMAISKKLLGYKDDDDFELRESARQRVMRGLRATVTSNSITGLARVDLKMVENPPPVPPHGWTPICTFVPPMPSLLDSFAVAATKLMNRLKSMDFDSVWSNVQRTADSAARLSENADAMIVSQRAGVQKIVEDVGSTAESLKALTEELRQNPSMLLRPSDPEPLPETAR